MGPQPLLLVLLLLVFVLEGCSSSKRLRSASRAGFVSSGASILSGSSGGRRRRVADQREPHSQQGRGAERVERAGVAGAARGAGSPLRAALVPIPKETALRILPSAATKEQFLDYWGRTEQQRVGKAFEAAVVAFLGLWACFFTSSFLGVGITSILGAGFAFFGLLSPSLSAWRKNSKLRSPLLRESSPNATAGLFSGRVTKVKEVRSVAGKPVFFDLDVHGDDERQLQFRVNWLPAYRLVCVGMQAHLVLVAEDPSFESIVGATDAYVPAADVWVGDYPYLQRGVFRRLLAERFKKKRPPPPRRPRPRSNSSGSPPSYQAGRYDPAQRDSPSGGTGGGQGRRPGRGGGGGEGGGRGGGGGGGGGRPPEVLRSEIETVGTQ